MILKSVVVSAIATVAVVVVLMAVYEALGLRMTPWTVFVLVLFLSFFSVSLKGRRRSHRRGEKKNRSDD